MRMIPFFLMLAALSAFGKVCNVHEYGASGMRADPATPAIQKAIDECAAAGGGTVLLPAGEYTAGSVRLRDNIELHIEAGATLYASRDRRELNRDWRALVYADGAKHISITGAGTIDGQAQYEWSAARQADPEIAEERTVAEKAGIEMKRYNHAGPGLFLVVFVDSSDVRFEGIRLINSQFWTIRLAGCDGLHPRRLRLHGPRARG